MRGARAGAGSGGGRVVLVGAGPGDPELITCKGLRWLQTADVVVYDRLVGRELLDQAVPTAELIDAGKEPGRHGMTQDEIHAVLIDRARQGLTVVRLKGGDPTIFGRAGEELEALRAAGIPVEIVPGVTAATAAAASAGFALTHRDQAGAVVLATGHEARGHERSLEEWRALSAVAGTLVFYMPVRRLVRIVDALLENGHAEDEPALLVQAASLSRERRLFAPLADLTDRARDLELHTPALLVVGSAVAGSPEWAASVAAGSERSARD